MFDKPIRGTLGDREKEKFITKEDGWCFIPTLPLQYDYINCDDMYPVLNQDKPMEIKLSLFVPGRISHTLSMDPPTPGAKVAISVLAQNMKTLLQDSTHSDVVLNCQQEDVSCHKNILAARSPVFYRMFDVDMEEKKSGVVEINDIDPAVLKAMINFIYTGEDVTEDVDDLAHLLYAGDKYELKGLLDLCYQKFLKTNDDSKLVEMLIVADRQNLKRSFWITLPYKSISSVILSRVIFFTFMTYYNAQ